MFGTSGIRGPVGEEITGDLALAVGRALASDGYDRVVIGRDVRPSGEFLADVLSAGCRECGADVFDAGIASTPTIARGVSTLDADVGVVITASHNPPPDNGIKLWTNTGKAFGPDRRAAIERRVTEGHFDVAPWDATGTKRTITHLEDVHSKAIRNSITIPNETTPSVIVDLGNGAGGITPRLLADLGCRVRSINDHRDGSFPGRPSEPTRESLTTLASLVGETDADLGIAHDGDADRMVAVDETGTFVPKDVLLAIFAVNEAGDGDRVAAPVDTSLAVEDALASVGASLTRTRVGDVYVAERSTESDVVFGGEPSGAWIWPDESSCPDGPLAACKLVELVANRGPLSNLVTSIEPYPIERGSIEVTEKTAVTNRITSRLEDGFDDVETGESVTGVDTLDGIRVETQSGWFLIRPSGTQPLVRITAEARTEAMAQELFEVARDLVENARSQ